MGLTFMGLTFMGLTFMGLTFMGLTFMGLVYLFKGVEMTRNVADIRNIAICGHGGLGKTTLVDQLLVASGAVSSKPSVDAGTSANAPRREGTPFG